MQITKEWLEEQLQNLYTQRDSHANGFHATLGAILAFQAALQRLAEQTPQEPNLEKP